MIRRVGVVGCGLMGSGIVEVVARAGLDVVVREVSSEFLQRGLSRVEASLARAVERKKLDAGAASDARARIAGTLTLDEFADVDLAIEAVVERMDEKRPYCERSNRCSARRHPCEHSLAVDARDGVVTVGRNRWSAAVFNLGRLCR